MAKGKDEVSVQQRRIQRFESARYVYTSISLPSHALHLYLTQRWKSPPCPKTPPSFIGMRTLSSFSICFAADWISA